MLKLPAFRQYDDVTVFQDDVDLERFYLIPGFPTVRTDKDGEPVFLLIKYAFSDQSREERPDLPRGGGYLAFDAQLAVAASRREEIAAELQEWVDKRWEELKRLPDDSLRTIKLAATLKSPVSELWRSGQPGFTGRAAPGIHDERPPEATLTMASHDPAFRPPEEAPPPKVVFGEPLWKSGTVKMNAPQAAGLVRHVVGERPAAMIGNNVAAFSLDLTEDGATFMQKTIVGERGDGATDLTPIQIVYDLKIVARLPPARVWIKFSTAELYSAVQELFHEKDSDPCEDDYFTSESMTETAIQSGLITVKIDAGGITDADTMELLQQQAQNTVTQLITQMFTKKERKPLEEWATEDVQNSGNEIYRLKQQTEMSMIDFEQTIELSTNVEYAIAPQGTLQTFLAGRSKQEMERFVREIDLDDDFFKTLSLSVRAFASWTEDPIEFVEVEVLYSHGTDVKTQTFTFTPADREPKKWDPSLIGRKREYTYRWRVGMRGKTPPPFTESDWLTTTSRQLNVTAATPGQLAMDVSGAVLDFEDVLDAVLVHLRYQDLARDVPLGGTTLLFTKDVRAGSWKRLLYAPWDRPAEYRVEYLLRTGATVRTEWLKTEGAQANLIVPRPQVDVLDVTLMPVGLGWPQVKNAIVSVAYQDPSDTSYNLDKQVAFDKDGLFKSVKFLLKNPTQRTFQYEVLTVFQNGDTERTPKTSLTGDSLVPVMAKGPPRLDVAVVAAAVDFSATPVVKVNLEYGEPDTPEHQSSSFVLQTNKDVPAWNVPQIPDQGSRYRYRITYYPTEGDPIERDVVETGDPRVVVPRYAISRAGTEVVAVNVDFSLVNAVEVNLRYVDPDRGVDAGETLVFTAPDRQSWWVAVDDDAPREYRAHVVYHLKDGGQVAIPEHPSTNRRYLLPAVKQPENL